MLAVQFCGHGPCHFTEEGLRLSDRSQYTHLLETLILKCSSHHDAGLLQTASQAHLPVLARDRISEPVWLGVSKTKCPRGN